LITSYIDLELDEGGYDPRGVLTSFRPPLYPAFLALIYSISGTGPQRFFIARLVQAVLASLLVPLTHALARRLFPERTGIAVLAAWMIALYPMLVIYPLSLATENLFFVLLTSACLVLVIAVQDTARKEGAGQQAPVGWFLLVGLLFGLTALTRSVSLVLAGFAVLWIWFRLKARRQAAIVFGMVAVVCLPWMVRNTLLHAQLTGIESALGYDLYVGYHPQGSGTFQYPQSLDLMTMLDDGERDKIGRARALDFIRDDPLRAVYLAVRRAGYFFGLERRALTYFYSNNFFGFLPRPLLLFLALVFCLPFMLVSLSAVLGIAFAPRRPALNLLLLVHAGYVLPHLFIIAEDRFHLALLPFLAILASAFWLRGLPLVAGQLTTRWGRRIRLAACLVLFLLLLNWGLELGRDADRLAMLFGPAGNLTFFPY
jgi:4-amino-4-deoxy-L-arabinose transferase-like glycosyltransferase